MRSWPHSTEWPPGYSCRPSSYRCGVDRVEITDCDINTQPWRSPLCTLRVHRARRRYALFGPWRRARHRDQHRDHARLREARELLVSNKELARCFAELEARLDKKLTEHDRAIGAILLAIRELMHPKGLQDILMRWLTSTNTTQRRKRLGKEEVAARSTDTHARWRCTSRRNCGTH